MEIEKIEAFLRVSSVLLLILTSCLIGFDTQSRIIFVEKRITYKELHALVILVHVASGASAYNLLQLGGAIFSSSFKGNGNKPHRYLACFCYLLDQMVVYSTFATNSAAVEHAFLALEGMKEFQWMRWCSKFTRFCFQSGGAFVCCYVACVLMA